MNRERGNSSLFSYLLLLLFFIFISSVATIKIALIHSDAQGAAEDVQTKLLSRNIYEEVGIFDASKNTPDSSYFVDLSAVLVWSRGKFADSDTLGNVISDFLIDGGAVVEGVFDMTTPSHSLGGRYVNDKPYINGGISIVSNRNLDTMNGLLSAEFLIGVHSFNAGINSYAAAITPSGPAITGLQYTDGTPLVIYNPPAFPSIVALNFYPPSSDYDPNNWDSSTDGVDLIVNSLNFVLDCTALADCDYDGFCETSVTTNINCGGCGVICSLPNAGESCATGACEITVCESGACETSRVLIVYSSSLVNAKDVQSKIKNTGYFPVVDLFDASTKTPSLNELSNYNAVFTFSETPYFDPVELGDNLFYYVEDGGGVVNAVFSDDSIYSSFSIQGLFLEIVPYESYGADGFYNQNLYMDLGSIQSESPFFNDVEYFDGGKASYQGIISGKEGSNTYATWDNGRPLIIAYSPFQVVTLNFFPPSSDVNAEYWDSNTDGDMLMRNALLAVSTCLYFNCDNIQENGCETFATSLINCGDCGITCEITNAIPTCLSGSCEISSCIDGYSNCNEGTNDGCETNILSLTDCGGCGNVCSPMNVVTQICNSEGECTYDICEDGYGDCDGYKDNGCEINLLVDTENCGGCQTKCYFPYATSGCLGGVCGVSSCNTAVCNPFSVLFYVATYNTYYAENIKNLLNQTFPGEFTTIDVIPAYSGEIELYLETTDYNAVFIWSDGSTFFNSSSLGTSLVKYLKNGGGIVTAYRVLEPYDFEFQSLNILGEFYRGGYPPWDSTLTDTSGDTVTLNKLIFDHELLNDVYNFEFSYGYIYDIVPNQNSIVVANYLEKGYPLIFYRPTVYNPIVTLNFDPTIFWNGDGLEIIRNSLFFASSCSVSGNCDGDLSNGCEPLNSLTNCQSCDSLCELPNAITTCASGTECQFVQCEPYFDNCDELTSTGCETNLKTVGNCGRCDIICEIANGTPDCSTGTCEVGGCDTEFSDCDGYSFNGCETSILSDTDCGACFKDCSLPYSITQCVNLACALRGCTSGGYCGQDLPSVLIITHDSNVNEVKVNLQTSGKFFIVDVLDPTQTLVSLSILINYQTVFYFQIEYVYFDRVLLGNVLAEYIDNGGGVVLGYGATTSEFSPSGNLVSYLPFTPISQQNTNYYTLGPLLADHPLLYSFNSFMTDYNAPGGYVTLKSNANLVAWYLQDHNPLIFYSAHPKANLVVLNFYPVTTNVDYLGNWDPLTSDGFLLIQNALEFSFTPCVTSANCDGDDSNGCELQNTIEYCGACDDNCFSVFPNADAFCYYSTGATCKIARCHDGWIDDNQIESDGCEFSIRTNTDCGAKGQVCSLPNAFSDCSTGDCKITDCHQDFLDCDQINSNGCESSIYDLRTCGTCNGCSPSVETPYSCVNAICELQPCIDNYNPLIKVLYLSDDDTSQIVSTLNAIEGLVVVSVKITNTMQDFSGFDTIIYSRRGSLLSKQYGDALADFVDDGGGVIILPVLTYLSGRIVTGGYLPVYPSAEDELTPGLPLYKNDHFLMSDLSDTPRISDTSIYCLDPELTPGSVTVGLWGDRNLSPAVIYKQVSTTPVVFLNFYPTTNNNFEILSDEANLYRNAIFYASQSFNSTNCGNGECKILNSLSNCGDCNTSCSFTNADASCFSYYCDLGQCNDGYCDGDFIESNGCEADLSSDEWNCGFCYNRCRSEHASVDCIDGYCYVGECLNGYADCDGYEFNDCETSIIADEDHCGTCENSCVAPNVAYNCHLFECEYGACTRSCKLNVVVITDDYVHLSDALIVFFQVPNVNIDYIAPLDQVTSIDDILPFDVVILFSIDSLASETTLGDILATFIDLGGGVVEMYYATDGANTIGGNFATYQPYSSTSHPDPVPGNSYYNMTKLIPDHPLLNGVNTFGGGTLSLRGNIEVNSIGVNVATWNDEYATPLVLYANYPKANLVVLNFYPVDNYLSFNAGYWDYFTDGVTLIQNAIYYSSNRCYSSYDCNGDITDGCNFLTEVEHCGACNTPCITPNAYPTCVDFTCQIGSCFDTYYDFNQIVSDGCEGRANNLTDCERIGIPCTGDFATMDCSDGYCAIQSCFADYFDCNKNPADGCEVHLPTDHDNCGGCGNVCNTIPNTVEECIAGSCSVVSCDYASDCAGFDLIILFNGGASSYSAYQVLENLSTFYSGEFTGIYATDASIISTLPDLSIYDAILYISDIGEQVDFPDQFGDLLCSYIDQGVGVVISQYATFSTSAIGGRFPQYQGLTPGSGAGIVGPYQVIDPTSPLLYGVTDFQVIEGSIPSGVVLGTALSVANLGTQPLVVYEPDKFVVTIDIDPIDSIQLTRNALLFSINTKACQSVANCDGYADGCEDRFTDINNCGECGKICEVANGLPTCELGVCAIQTCFAPFVDTDRDYDTGCEDSLTNNTNCYSNNGESCTVWHGIANCSTGVCLSDGCEDGYSNCDSYVDCETTVNDQYCPCSPCSDYATTTSNPTCDIPSRTCKNNCIPETESMRVAILSTLTVLGYSPLIDVLEQFFGVVDVIDCTNQTPTLSVLLQYHSVLVVTDLYFQNHEEMGNVLADYVDLGGGVVLTTKTFECDYCEYSIGGRFRDAAYSPLSNCYNYQPQTSTIVPYSTPFFEDIPSYFFGGHYYCDSFSLNGFPATSGDYLTGQIPVVLYNNMKVIVLNISPYSSVVDPQSWVLNGPMKYLIRNALKLSSKVNTLDCDGLVSNGCEVLSSDPVSCGSCNEVCPPPSHTTSACTAGFCTIGTCEDGYADCNGAPNDGCEISLLTDQYNCAACGYSCYNLHNVVEASCDGTCQINQCYPNYGNCDNDPTNGCETDLTSDTENCGECGLTCQPPNTIGSCIDSSCIIDCINTGCPAVKSLILYSASEDEVSDVKTKLENTGTFLTVDKFDISTNNPVLPTIEFLQQYHSILIFTNSDVNLYEIFDSTAIGDLIADAIDYGIGVVECLSSIHYGNPESYDEYEYYGEFFTGYPSKVSIGGRYKSDNYMPYLRYFDKRRNQRERESGCGSTRDLYPELGMRSHPLLKDVDNVYFGCGYPYSLTLSDDAILVAYWSNEAYAVYYKTVSTTPVIVLNFYPPSSDVDGYNWDSDTDGAILMRNALHFSADCIIPTADCDDSLLNGCEPLNTLENCGFCEVTCKLPNATPTCNTGTCEIFSCNPGYANCDNLAETGCESLQTPTNCGTCGSICSPPNAFGSCETGVCKIIECIDGFYNCDGNILNGCESTAVCAPCDLPGGVCTLPQVLTTICVGSNCYIDQCITGFGDCDGIIGNGCEEDLVSNMSCGICYLPCSIPNANSICSSDGDCIFDSCITDFANCNNNITKDGCESYFGSTSSCGTCNSVCSFSNAVALCEKNSNDIFTCLMGPCIDGFDNCDGYTFNGCEIPTTTTNHCGSCGNICGLIANGVPSCHNGECKPVCLENFDDCNGIYEDGCEVYLLSDASNCNGCRNKCEYTNGSGVCNNGYCDLGTCDLGFDNCDGYDYNGCEFPANTLTDCGTCGTPCSLFLANTTDCSTGVCTVVKCDDGYATCDGFDANGCETNILYDVNNCLECGNDCSALPHVIFPSCKNGCSYDCELGYADCTSDPGCETNAPYCPISCSTPGTGDCDGYYGNGCETYLNSVDHCGDCGTICFAVYYKTVPICNQNSLTCDFQCEDGYSNCDFIPDCETASSICPCQALTFDCDHNGDCETDLTSIFDCGTCDNICSVPNANPSCDGYSCSIGSCIPNFLDCDGYAGNGCEYSGDICPCVFPLADCNSDRITDGCETILTTLDNCGGCNQTCNIANGVGDCSTGVCTILSCDTGFKDCNFYSLDGCETNVLSDPKNCSDCYFTCPALNAIPICDLGYCSYICDSNHLDCNTFNGCETKRSISQCTDCGVPCDLSNATPLCIEGTCKIESCNLPFGDCDGYAFNGCESNLINNIFNCGSCGYNCSAQMVNANTVCTSSGCSWTSCLPNFANCDGNFTNGCETNLLTNSSHCGGCNQPCNPPNALGKCSNGLCSIDICSRTFLDCNGNPVDGCETSVGSISSCGGCSSACSLPNAISVCNSQENICVVQSCFGGFADCDNNPVNGCETSITSNNHCGACNTPCSASNAETSCASGSCVLSKCNSGFIDCDRSISNGCEAQLGSVNSCSGCNDICNFPNATALCISNSCSFICLGNFGNCDGNNGNGCESNLSVDNNNCGRCGNQCGAALSCIDGLCTTSVPSLSPSRSPLVACLFFY